MPSFTIAPRQETVCFEGQRSRQIWALPTDCGFLQEFLTYVFVNYWDQIVFGPIIQGAAYEFTCPHSPSHIDESNGFLSIHFGASHFHLCIDGKDRPAESGVSPHDAHRPVRAVIFRQLDGTGHPISWGFEMWNGLDHPMLSIFFGSPFIEPGDKLLAAPQWERLAMWRDIAQRYLGRAPETFDESGKGFVNGNY